MKHPATTIENHLLVSISAGFIAGIASGPLLRLTRTSQTTLLLSLAGIAILLTALYLLKYKRTVLCSLPLLFAALGALHVSQHMQTPRDPHHIYNRISEKTEAVIVGTMMTMAGFDGRTGRTVIDCEEVRFKSSQQLLSTSGKIQVRIQGQWPERYQPGDKLVIRASLKRPDSYASPGSFDHARYLAQKDVWITGFIRSPWLIYRLPGETGMLHGLQYLPQRIRTTIGEHIDRALPPPTNGLYRALLLGDRSRVSGEILEMFKASGVLHILAISGLHMAVVGTLLYFIIYWILSRSEKLLLNWPVIKISAGICLPLLVGYALLAGMNSPVTRAVIMSALVIIAVSADRKKSPAPLIAAAATLILSFEPLQLFTASFQLSFAAITGILLLLPLLQGLFSCWITDNYLPNRGTALIQWLLAGLLVSTVATLATAPISLTTFNRISLTGPIANLLVEPLLCLWALPLGILSLPISAVFPHLSDNMLILGGFGIDITLKLVSFFASFPFSSLWLPTPPFWLITLYYSTLMFMVLGNKGRIRDILLPSSISLLLFFFIFLPPWVDGGKGPFSTVVFFDVGQGSATLLEFSSGETVLVDGGGSSFTRTSVGERVIAPYLWYSGIRKLDAIIITHPDADHYNGLGFIVKHFPPETLWVRKTEDGDDRFRDFFSAMEKSGTRIVVPTAGQTLIDGELRLECLYNFAASSAAEENGPDCIRNRGLIIRACFDGQCVLLPGDIDVSAEEELINSGRDFQSKFLLAAHHGSRTSNSEEFLGAVRPETVIVSAGSRHSPYFPAPILQEITARSGIQLLSTADLGTIEIVLNGKDTEQYHYQKYDQNPLYGFEKVPLR